MATDDRMPSGFRRSEIMDLSAIPVVDAMNAQLNAYLDEMLEWSMEQQREGVVVRRKASQSGEAQEYRVVDSSMGKIVIMSFSMFAAMSVNNKRPS